MPVNTSSIIITDLFPMSRKNISFLIVGDGPYRQELENLTSDKNMEDQIIFTGMVETSQIAQYYQLSIDLLLSVDVRKIEVEKLLQLENNRSLDGDVSRLQSIDQVED